MVRFFSSRLTSKIFDAEAATNSYSCAVRQAVKAKFHYAILVADRPEAGGGPVADLLARALRPG